MRKSFFVALMFLALGANIALFIPQVASAADTCPAGQEMRRMRLGWGSASIPTLRWECVNKTTGEVTGEITGGTFVRAEPTVCSGGLGDISKPSCWLSALIAFSASIFTWLGAWILVFAANLFDVTLKYTVVQFNVIYDLTREWIEKGWQVFRDLANIGIIGIFTFIAISFILGIKEYGEKRLIANVLIVAVLINFSLLFTKMTINASNALSSAIYASQLSSTQAATPTQAFNPFSGGVSDQGVSGRFIKALGLSSFGDAYQQNINIGNQSGYIGQLMYGLLFILLYTFAGIVFLYGSFILIARAILLILLLITSAAAFSTYMIPSLAKSEYGWSTWWSSLLRSSVLMPIMLVLLSISLGMAEGLTKCPPGANACNTGSLGNLVGHPDNVADVQKFLNYIFVLGLLFATFKVASGLASTIAGLRLASQLSATGAFGSVYLGYGMLGRNTLGRFSARRSDALGKKLDELKTKRDTATSPLKKSYYDWRARAADSKKQRSDKVAKSDFNLGNTKVGAGLASIFGATGLATKGGGIAGREAEAAKKIAEKATRLASGDDQKKAVRQQASDNELKQKNLLTQQKQAVEANKQAAEATKKAMEASVETEKGIEARMREDHDTTIKALHKEIGTIETGGGDSSAKRAELARTSAQHADAMNAQKSRIEHAKATVEGTTAWKDIQAKIAQHANEMEEIDGKISKIKTPDQAVQQLEADSGERAASMARRRGLNYRVQALARKKFGEVKKLKARKEKIEAEKAYDEEHGLAEKKTDKKEDKKGDAH